MVGVVDYHFSFLRDERVEKNVPENQNFLKKLKVCIEKRFGEVLRT